MQRRSVVGQSAANDLESVVSSSQGSLRSHTKLSRKSIAAAVTDRALHDETRPKFFPMMILLMEFMYAFVSGSSEVYSCYGLAGYTTIMGQHLALNLMITYRFLGTLVALPIAIICDSYFGSYYSVVFFLLPLSGLMGLHAVISLPWMLISPESKLFLAELTFPIFTIYVPLKLVTISRAVMESNYFREPRNFYAMLACAINLGIGAGGTVIYFSIRSRYALCTVMFADFAMIVIYTGFFIAARRHIISDKAAKMENFGVVEKAFAAIVCLFFKLFDKYVFRKIIFKGSSYIDGDFRCFVLSQNTMKNARAVIGIILVTLPLTAALTMLILVDTLYYIELDMFYYYPHDPFPLLAIKGYVFLVIFPFVEYYLAPALRKWSRTEASRQLTMVGLGALCVSCSLCWVSVVHKIARDGRDFWYRALPGTGHVAITNCINEPLRIRSQYMNILVDDSDSWTILPPFKTITILDVPEESSPLHFEYSNTRMSIYDEYFLPFRTLRPTWYVITPSGVYSVPPLCYRRNSSSITITSSFYRPAIVCAICAMSVCNGYVTFSKTGVVNPHKYDDTDDQIPLVALTGRGTNVSIDADRIAGFLVGDYTVSTSFGGVLYLGSRVNATFYRKDTYFVIAYENLKGSYFNDSELDVAGTEQTVRIQDSAPVDNGSLVSITLMQTSPKKTRHVAWMYPTVFFHALSEVLYLVSLWMFLFTQCPDQIRTTMFSFIEILRTPSFIYMFLEDAISLRKLDPITYFYLASINCFFIIVYFFCILFFIHKSKMEVDDRERDFLFVKSNVISSNDGQSENTENTTNSPSTEVQANIPGEMAEQIAFYTRFMNMACLVNECMVSFVTFSNELFLVHGLSGFCTPYSAEYVLHRVSKVKSVAAPCSLVFGLVLGSYLHRVRYYVILCCGILLVVWPSMYLVLAYPVYWQGEENANIKEEVFYWGSVFHGLAILVHHARVALVLERALEDRKLSDSRRFIGLLVFAQQLGELLAGCAIFISRSSRKLYTGLMCTNVVLCVFYVVFWFFWTHGFANDEKTHFACVEKAVVSSFLYILKRIDQAWCKGISFRKHYGFQDYRCLHFSERTAANTWCLLTSLLVLLPLVGFFVTDAAINYLYISQYSSLALETEYFSVLAYKAGYFIVLYPVCEFLIFPSFRRLIRNDLTRLLLSIGTGAFFMGLAVALCALIQQKLSPVEQDVVNVLNTHSDASFAHAVIVNLVDIDSEIRGNYFNRLLIQPKNAWKTLKPYDPFKVLHFPIESLPFNISVRNDHYKIYDEYSFMLKVFSFNWLVIHPYGMFMLRSGTFHQNPQIGMNPAMFRAAFVNIICRLPVCDGILEFRQNGRYHNRVFFPFRDDQQGIETFQLAGKYEVGFSLVGNKSTETVIYVEFYRLRIYLLVISGSMNRDDGRTKIEVVQASHQSVETNVWVLFAPTFFHGLSYVFGYTALYQWLHITCRKDLRCFMFSIPVFLTTITYSYFTKTEPTSLQTAGSISIFSYACVVWILLILYGVTCLRYVQLWNKQTDAAKPKKRHKSTNKRKRKANNVGQQLLPERDDSNEGQAAVGEKDKDT